MNIRLFACAGLAALALGSAAYAEPRVAAGAGYGTTGVNAAVEYKASERWTLRGSADHLYFDDDVKVRNVEYSADSETNVFIGQAQFHPWNNELFFSGGVVVGERRIEVDARPSGPVSIGGYTFTPAQVGRLDGEADFGEVAPFIGVGLDTTFHTDSRLGLRLSAGVAVSQAPDVNLRASGGTLSSHPAFESALDAEADEIEDDIEFLRFYPVVEAGLTWRF